MKQKPSLVIIQPANSPGIVLDTSVLSYDIVRCILEDTKIKKVKKNALRKQKKIERERQ